MGFTTNKKLAKFANVQKSKKMLFLQKTLEIETETFINIMVPLNDHGARGFFRELEPDRRNVGELVAECFRDVIAVAVPLSTERTRCIQDFFKSGNVQRMFCIHFALIIITFMHQYVKYFRQNQK